MRGAARRSLPDEVFAVVHIMYAAAYHVPKGKAARLCSIHGRRTMLFVALADDCCRGATESSSKSPARFRHPTLSMGLLRGQTRIWIETPKDKPISVAIPALLAPWGGEKSQ
jgi:hypothetical protein